MRLFVAIDIPADAQMALGALLNHLRPTAKLSWTSVDKLHITTKFIGEWQEDRIEEMKQSLEGMDRTGAFEVTIAGLGWFPDARNSRVLFAKVDGGEPLRSLAKATEGAAHRLGIPAETRACSPHLTLARVRDRVSLDALKRAIDALASTDFGTFRAQTFYLYLSSAGHYTKLAEFSLV
jgi:RNA 2',3'-cyclic 3'-phosphodiesterase